MEKKKKRFHLYMYGCLLVSGAEVVQFLSIKTSLQYIFPYFVFKLLFEEKGGVIFGHHNLPLATKNLYLITSLCPY